MNKKGFSIGLLIVIVGILALASTACSSAAEAQTVDSNRYGQGGPVNVETQPQDELAADLPALAAGGNGTAGPGFESDTRGAFSRGAPDAIQQGIVNGLSENGRGRGGRGSGNGGRGTGGIGGGGTVPAGELSVEEAGALLLAIEEEYGARALYEGVTATYGAVEPFTWIINSETQHAAALIRLGERYGLDIPEYPGAAVLSDIDTLQAACQAGVQAEIADAALYDALMLQTEKPDLLRVFENLQRASLQSHLPAFQACE